MSDYSFSSLNVCLPALKPLDVTSISYPLMMHKAYRLYSGQIFLHNCLGHSSCLPSNTVRPPLRYPFLSDRLNTLPTVIQFFKQQPLDLSARASNNVESEDFALQWSVSVRPTL
ncbi:hypothetical protein ACTXT7_014217 [Hymenolepis weldensis]